MRILALSHLYPHAEESRYGIFVARQLQAMAEANAEITLLVPRPRIPKLLLTLLGKKPTASALVDYPGVRATAVPYHAAPGKWFWRWAGFAAYQATRDIARKLHSEHPFDVIYSTQLILSGDAGSRLSHELKIPNACLAIGSDVNVIAKQSSGMKRHYRRILSRLDGCLTCGQSLATEIDAIRSHPTQLASLCVYGVVDLDSFSPSDTRAAESIRNERGLPVHGKIILYVGYLRREKGLLELLKAFQIVRENHSNSTLVLCGAGEDEQLLKERTKSLGLNEHVRFLGMVEPSSVRDYFRASDLFVLPSHNEGMPNAVMEAMACGLPVVCTDVGGLAAALSTSKGARLVPAKEIEPLQSAMSEVLANDDLHKAMSRAARATAEEQFDVRRNAQRILDYLAQVVQHSKGRR